MFEQKLSPESFTRRRYSSFRRFANTPFYGILKTTTYVIKAKQKAIGRWSISTYYHRLGRFHVTLCHRVEYSLVNVIQIAWKNIKDTHIKVRQKWEKRGGDANPFGSEANRWKFWDAMEFMRDIPVLPRNRKR